MAKACVVGAALALGLTGAAQAAVDPIQSAFVVLGDGGRAEARVVTAEMTCPMIDIDGESRPMAVRAAAGTVPLRPTRSKPSESKPAEFPVMVCEASLPPGAKAAMVGGRRLPVPAAEPRRIVVIGDTGCRIKTADNAAQACNDPGEYPFARVAASAAAFRPDLVIHVGDYLYRENPCPVGNTGCFGSPWGSGWDAWNADFFAPGAALLAAAPWAADRGNHENCNRAGQGWWRFLDPRPLVPGRDCNDPANDKVGDYTDPYAIPLGGGAQIIMLDSSNTPGDAIPPDDYRAAQYRDMYAKMDGLARMAPYNIVVDHHPVLSATAHLDKDTGKPKIEGGNGGLQSVFSGQNPWLFPPTVKMLLAGHVHVWEQVSFSSPHPTQFVAGFSGTQEDIVPLPKTLPDSVYVAPGAAVERFSSWVDGFGFMTMVRSGPESWDIEIHDVNGKVLNHCKAEGRKSSCDLPQVVAPSRP
ncbi:MAG: metallophosphoesterase [Caulobacteraceae bacterium]